ncbi:hypothetical protein [uncultured Rubinisphaera sp.]|mgnify:CR=1 FL=1|uniref:hypothetical protein n=1 Tax=uncultured Rubinisphaera sp. TaxID=1678686 RepID=UPI0030DB82D5
MNENQYEPQPHQPHAVVERNDAVIENNYPVISWGAIFAGLVVVLSLGWLLHLLGLAFGVSVADAMDSANMEGGLSVGATIWIVLSWMIAFFVGALVSARLAGRVDDFSGMLHGLTLWGIATIATVVLGYYGVSSLLQTGQQLVVATAQGVGEAGAQVANASGYAAQGVQSATAQITNQFGSRIQDRLADQASEIAASSTPQLSEQEIRNVINGLDERTMRRLVLDLTNNDQDGAAQLLADSTELSEQDAQALIQSAYNELEQQFGNPENQQTLAQDLKNQFARSVDNYVASLDASGGTEVTEQDVRRAISSLDAQAVQQIAMSLSANDERGVKRVIAQNTSLTVDEIDELYKGAMQGVEDEVEEFNQQVTQTLEAISTYTSQVLWIAFIGTALGLAVSLAGGWLGADSSRRVYGVRT